MSRSLLRRNLEYFDVQDGDGYFHTKPHHRIRLERMMELIRAEVHHSDYVAACKVLDVGCAGGVVAGRVRALGPHVYGLDGSPAALAAVAALGVNPVQGDMEEPLPFADNTFDVVIASEVLEHLFDPPGLVKEIRRVLKPRGGVIFTVPNIATLVDRIYMLFGGLPWQASLRHPLHIRCFTLSSLKEMLVECDLQPERITSNTLYLGTRHRKWLSSSWLAKWLPQFGDNLILLARNTKQV